MTELFISHSKQDHALAKQFCDALEARGVRCFIAPRDLTPGRDYPDEIIRGIDSSPLFLLLLTEESNQSVHVKRELERALDRRRTIFTLRVDDVKPAPGIEYFIGVTQWLSARRDEPEASLEALINVVQTALGVAQQKTVSGAHASDPPPATRGSPSQAPSDHPPEAAPASQPAVTPNASLLGTMGAKTGFVTGLATAPLWRGRGEEADALRFSPPPEGFVQLPKTLSLSIPHDDRMRIVGRRSDCDLSLVHKSVSRRCLWVGTRDGRVFVKRHPECSVPIRVGLSLLEGDQERELLHGEPIVLGKIQGLFVDGRFIQPYVPLNAVDPGTGLLGRRGLEWELSIELKLKGKARFALVREAEAQAEGSGERAQVTAMRAALCMHRALPRHAVARFDDYAALLLRSDADLTRAQASLDELPPREPQDDRPALLWGHYVAEGDATTAAAQIDAALSALGRVARSSRTSQVSADGAPVVSLNEHALPETSPATFVERAQQVLSGGGGMGMLALEQTELLSEIGPGVPEALELELLQVVGQLAGEGALVTRPARGVVAFAAAEAPEPLMREVVAQWRARPAIQGRVLEVDRALAMAALFAADLPRLPQRARELAAAVAEGIGLEGMPYPIAVYAQRFMRADGFAQQREAASALLEATWRFLAIVLSGMMHAGSASASGAPTSRGRAETFPERASAASRMLRDTPGRVGELVRSCFAPDGRPTAILDNASQRITSAGLSAAAPGGEGESGLRQAVQELLTALHLLCGWTLASIAQVERLDAFGETQSVRYLDHTGSSDEGLERELTAVRDLHMGPFVYLARFAEGIAAPLEPLLRLCACPSCGRRELFWARQLITTPGTHEYQAVGTGHTLQAEVTTRQIPRIHR